MDRDPRFAYNERRLKNRFVFEFVGADTLLNYWEIEQNENRYFKSKKRTRDREQPTRGL